MQSDLPPSRPLQVYLRSIKSYFSNDDDFNWNYGIACAAAGEYKEGKEALLMIQNER
jgi:intraflagellar transport protein 56